MPVTALVFFLVIAGGIAAFLALLPRLTYSEKKRAFALAIGAFPVVGIVSYFVIGAMHHEAYEAGPQALPEDISPLIALSCLLGLIVSGVLLWGAGYLNAQRTYKDFAEAQREELRAIERAKEAELAREERMIQGRERVARLEAQGHVLAIERDRARIQADEDRANLRHQEQSLLLMYNRFCLSTGWDQTVPEDVMKARFRAQLAGEMGRRSIGRLDMQALTASSNPEVRALLDNKVELKLTPGG